MAVNQNNQAGLSAMASSLNFNQGQVNQPQVGQTQQEEPQVTSGYAPDENGRFSWINISALTDQRVSVTPHGEVLKQAEKNIAQFWENNLNQNINLEMIAIDRTNVPNLAVSLLVVTMQSVINGVPKLAHHTLLLEGSTEPFPTRRENIQDHTVDIMDLVSDTYDQVMQEAIRQAVIQAYPNIHPDNILDGDAEVIPRAFDWTNETNMHYLTLNCVLANRLQLDSVNTKFKDLSLINAINDSTLNVTVNYHQGQEPDWTNLPVRSDITIDLTAHQSNKSNKKFGNAQKTIGRATGFIDLQWNQVAQIPQFPQQALQWGQFNSPLKPTYQANLVLTQLSPFDLQTLPAMFTILLAASYVAENNSWVGALRPIYDGSNRLPLHDIGAIGYDVQPLGKPERIITTPDQFDINGLMQLIGTYFHPGLVISIDVPEVGSNSWALGVFAEAALGDKSALDYIRAKANYYTGGLFSQLYQGTGQFFTTNENIILNGYYTDDKDQRRDIRDIDYLVVASELGEKNPQVIADWTNSYANKLDPTLRSCARQTIIQNLRNNAVFTGKSIRIDVEAAFLQALSAGAKQCNFTMTPQFPNMNSLVHERANATYINGSVLTQYNSGIFRPGSITVGNNNGHASRWAVR